VSQSLLLFPTVPDEDWLHLRQAEGTFRASAQFVAGPFAGMGVLTTEGNHAEETVVLRSGTMVSGVPPLPIPIIPIPGPVSSHLPPMKVILFLLVSVTPGQSRAVAQALVELGDERAAYAHAFPPDGSFNLVLELVGDDLEETLDRALTAVDRPDVSHVRTLHTTRSLTRGFGGDTGAAGS
jgi:hypothetical protein